MHCLIRAVFLHQHAHFPVCCANAVPSAVHNHENCGLAILGNAECRSGLSALGNNGVCLYDFPVNQQLAAAAKGGFHPVQVHRGIDIQCHLVAHLEHICRLIAIIAAHHD